MTHSSVLYGASFGMSARYSLIEPCGLSTNSSCGVTSARQKMPKVLERYWTFACLLVFVFTQVTTYPCSLPMSRSLSRTALPTLVKRAGAFSKMNTFGLMRSKVIFATPYILLFCCASAPRCVPLDLSFIVLAADRPEQIGTADTTSMSWQFSWKNFSSSSDLKSVAIESRLPLRTSCLMFLCLISF